MNDSATLITYVGVPAFITFWHICSMLAYYILKRYYIVLMLSDHDVLLIFISLLGPITLILILIMKTLEMVFLNDI